jgi:hypothetical protein
VRLEGLGSTDKYNDLIGKQTRDLPACSIVPQPTTPRRAPDINVGRGPLECNFDITLGGLFQDFRTEETMEYLETSWPIAGPSGYKLQFQI